VTRSDTALYLSVYSVVMKTQTGMAQGDSVTDSTTIEVMLTPQQVNVMSKGSQLDATQHRSRLLSGAAIAAVLAVLGGVAHLAAKQKPVPAVVAQAPRPTPPPPPAEAPAPAGEPVLYKNPFDRTEVFEFPPGTSQAEARDAVAKALMERAQGRPEVLNLKIRKAHASARTHQSSSAIPATSPQSGRSGPRASS
jgi:hypothetical protein